MQAQTLDFDIDVDLAPLLGTLAAPMTINARWYELLAGAKTRPFQLQRKIETAHHREILFAQWQARHLRARDQRRAIRAPLVSPIHVLHGSRLTATDISLSGLGCSGRPATPVVDVEFRLPGLAFPIDARAQVVSFKDANVIPRVGMRFVSIDRAYVDLIGRYIDTRARKERLVA